MEHKQDGVHPTGAAGGPPKQPPPGIHPLDGTFDFSMQTVPQLKNLLNTLNPNVFPASYAKLRAELQRRNTPPQPAPLYKPALRAAERVRFTPQDGFRGWLYAVLRRMPLYGAGSIDIMNRGRGVSGQELLVEGWQRSWSGVPERVLLGIGLERICNTAREHNRVRFEYEQRFMPARPIEVQMRSPEAAQRLMARLPLVTPTPALARWKQRRELARRLFELTPTPWVTPALMLLTLLAYLVTLISAAASAPVDPSLALDWGASFGPLTLNGQWWRLLTAAFLSWTPAQLVVNLAVLWTLGNLTERLYGSWPFLLIYVTGAVAGSAMSLFWDPSVISLGASGALWGVAGALTVFLAQRHAELPEAIWRCPWPGTLLLLAFTVMSCFINTGMDLAACIGGALSGVGAGLLLLRPPHRDARLSFPFKEALAVTMLTPLMVAALVWQTIPERISPAESYFQQHQWLTRGASLAETRWQSLLSDLHHGKISDQELQQRFEKQILPFWRNSAQSLQQEAQSVPAAERPLADSLTHLAQLRLNAATAAIAAMTQRDPAKLDEAQQLSFETNLAQAQIERVQLRITMSYRALGAAHHPWLMALEAPLLFPRCINDPGEPTAGDSSDTWNGANAGDAAEGDARGEGVDASRESSGCQAQRLFLGGHYAQLDALVQRASTHLADLPEGASTLSGIDAGLTALFADGQLPLDEALTRTAAWQRQLPASKLPDLLEARIFQTWAWQGRDARAEQAARQDSQASQPPQAIAARPASPESPDSPDTWLLAATREAMAADSLHDSRGRGTPGPLWYALSLGLSRDARENPGEARPVFNEGIKRFPKYLPLYREMLRIELPTRSQERVDSLIREVSQARPATNLALYARLYLTYAELVQDEINIFTQALAQWPLMKAGLIELRREYPQSDYFLNAYAKSACDADDPQQYAAVRPLLDARFQPDVWSNRTSLASCDRRMKLQTAQAGPPPAPMP